LETSLSNLGLAEHISFLWFNSKCGLEDPSGRRIVLSSVHLKQVTVRVSCTLIRTELGENTKREVPMLLDKQDGSICLS
jgi:hypothetical protein